MMRFAPERADRWFTSLMDPFTSADNGLMKTDIREKDGKYFLDINLAGYGKEDIKISLYNGTLNVAADHTSDNETKDSEGRVIRKERFTGSCKRSWYIGEGISENDIHAAFENGVLTVEVPKEAKKEEPKEKQIAIL